MANFEFAPFYQNARAWARRFGTEIPEAWARGAYNTLSANIESCRKAAIIASAFVALRDSIANKTERLEVSIAIAEALRVYCYYPEQLPQAATTPWMVYRIQLAKSSASTNVPTMVKAHKDLINKVCADALSVRNSERQTTSLANVIMAKAR